MKKKINRYTILIIFLMLFIFKDYLYSLINIKKIQIDNCIYLKNIEKNYEELLEFSNIEINYNIDYLNSYIIYKDIYNYLKEVTILGGKDKNLKENDPVIFNNTLVGTIKKVNKTTSIVKLITNNESILSVKINNEIGILEYDNTLKITGISNYGNIAIGDEIYTSGFGNIPENIYIGKVKDIILDSKNIEKIIYLDYSIDLKGINYVTILKESKVWFI